MIGICGSTGNGTRRGNGRLGKAFVIHYTALLFLVQNAALQETGHASVTVPAAATPVSLEIVWVLWFLAGRQKPGGQYWSSRVQARLLLPPYAQSVMLLL